MRSMSAKKSLSVQDLKHLLSEILDQRPDISIRYRLMGEMWNTSFMRIVFTTDSGAFFRDDKHNRLVHLSKLNSIIQFELNNRFRDFLAHVHYDIIPTRR
jgi:hypothetical protein